MRRLAAFALLLVLAACGKTDAPPAPAPHPGAAPGAPPQAGPAAPPANPPAPKDPPPPDSPDWKGSRVAIAVAERTLREHLDLLEAQSPFRVPNSPGFQRTELDEDVRFSWGKTGTFWEVYLDLCDRAGLTFRDDTMGPTYLRHGHHRVKGLQAVGPALVGVTDVMLSRDVNLNFKLWMSFEPAAAPEDIKYPRVQLGTIAPTNGGGSGSGHAFAWSYFAWGRPPGALDAWFEIPRAATFAHLELDPAPGSTAAVPGGRGKATVKAVDGATITTIEQGLEVRERWLMRKDESKAAPSDYHVEGGAAEKEWRVIFPEPFPPGALYVLKAVSGWDTKRFHARIDAPDWEAWLREAAPLKGIIRWQHPAAGAVEVVVSVARVEGGVAVAGGGLRVTFRCDPARVRSGGTEAASQRGWVTAGPLGLGLREHDPFLSYRAESLDEGKWLVVARAGTCVEAHGFEVKTNWRFPDVDLVLEPAADLSGTVPAGAAARLVPCDFEGKPFAVPAGALGPLDPIAFDPRGAFELRGLKPGRYILEAGGRSVALTLRPGPNSARIE